eukprot:TRINITY_DN1304_c0_g1_i6.p1 TRINITY_DN1304_c0_g1~~TRINITY_DN1304_c0_g1_i6.p1  ORF type:complete len:524 (+),score=128.10 TRINITY_DN1304_c0_g1_i6:76-1647(+)
MRPIVPSSLPHHPLHSHAHNDPKPQHHPLHPQLATKTAPPLPQKASMATPSIPAPSKPLPTPPPRISVARTPVVQPPQPAKPSKPLPPAPAPAKQTPLKQPLPPLPSKPSSAVRPSMVNRQVARVASPNKARRMQSPLGQRRTQQAATPATREKPNKPLPQPPPKPNNIINNNNNATSSIQPARPSKPLPSRPVMQRIMSFRLRPVAPVIDNNVKPSPPAGDKPTADDDDDDDDDDDLEISADSESDRGSTEITQPLPQYKSGVVSRPSWAKPPIPPVPNKALPSPPNRARVMRERAARSPLVTGLRNAASPARPSPKHRRSSSRKITAIPRPSSSIPASAHIAHSRRVSFKRVNSRPNLAEFKNAAQSPFPASMKPSLSPRVISTPAPAPVVAPPPLEAPVTFSIKLNKSRKSCIVTLITSSDQAHITTVEISDFEILHSQMEALFPGPDTPYASTMISASTWAPVYLPRFPQARTILFGSLHRWLDRLEAYLDEIGKVPEFLNAQPMWRFQQQQQKKANQA